MGLCGVEREKRFVNVHLHFIVNNLKRISKISTLPPLEKFLRAPMGMGSAVKLVSCVLCMPSL